MLVLVGDGGGGVLVPRGMRFAAVVVVAGCGGGGGGGCGVVGGVEAVEATGCKRGVYCLRSMFWSMEGREGEGCMLCSAGGGSAGGGK